MTTPPNGDTSPSDQELLAAYLDGTATEEQRARVLRRAAESPEWRELLAESARAIAELEEFRTLDEQERAGALPAPADAPPDGRTASAPHVLLPLAAVVLVGLVLALWLPRWRNDPLDAAALAASLQGSVQGDRPLEERWFDSPIYPRMRGVDGRAAATTPADAFVLGARAVDLELARSLEEPDAAAFIAGRIVEVCGRDDALLPCEAYFTDTVDAPDRLWEESSAPPSILLEIEPELANRLGRWAEASRLAAALGKDPFFRTLAWSEGLELLASPTLDPRLRQIAERLGELAREEPARLEPELSQLIRDIANRTLPL